MTAAEPMPDLCACGCGEPAVAWRLAKRCAHLLAGACLGKKRWPERYAKKIAVIVGKGSYQCPVCGRWHNGTDLGERGAAINAERYAVIFRLRRSGQGWVLTHLAAIFEDADRVEWKTRNWKAGQS